MKKKVVIVTEIELWKWGRGSQSRVQELINYLDKNCTLTIIYLAEKSFDFNLAKTIYPSLNIVVFFRKESDPQVPITELREFLHNKSFDIAIIEYLILHWVVDLLPENTVSVLDSHDILSHRAKSFREHNRIAYYDITEDREFELFNKFNKIMFIQEEELQTATKILDTSTTESLLCPHPVTCSPVEIINNKTVGFLGSSGEANVDSLIWLNDKIIPQVKDNDLTYAVYGEIVSRRELVQRCPRLMFIKPVEKLVEFYANISVAANPVLFGGGLKIKCVEALAYGVPLITTRVGAQGLMNEAGNSFLMANNASEFASHIDLLISKDSERQRLISNALSFMSASMSPDACFEKILTNTI
jgi:glycosyltransferase involved in cell wall biosynthesis